jgi:hypothetical protein
MGFGGDILTFGVQVGILEESPVKDVWRGLDKTLFSGHRYVVGSVREERKTSFRVKSGGDPVGRRFNPWRDCFPETLRALKRHSKSFSSPPIYNFYCG